MSADKLDAFYKWAYEEYGRAKVGRRRQFIPSDDDRRIYDSELEDQRCMFRNWRRWLWAQEVEAHRRSKLSAHERDAEDKSREENRRWHAYLARSEAEQDERDRRWSNRVREDYHLGPGGWSESHVYD
jgi:hypothetical protein